MCKALTIFFLGASIASLGTGLPRPTYAQAGDCSFLNFKTSFDCVSQLQAQSGIKDQEPRAFVLTILRYALQLVAVIAVIAILIAGGLYLISAGDEKKAATAKHALIYAIIGLIVIGSALIIVNVIIRALQGTI